MIKIKKKDWVFSKSNQILFNIITNTFLERKNYI